MARHEASHISDALTSLLPRRRIRLLAQRLGVIRRRRKLDIVALVYALVLGFSSGERRTLSALRRVYLRTTGTRLAPSSFYARFTNGLVKLMRALTLEALETMARARPKLRGVFAPFVEVLAVDSALLRLSDALQAFYPSVWSHYMKASAKLTVVMNVMGRSAKSVSLTHGSHHDTHLLKAGRWVQGRLLIFDLGFFGVPLFQRIDAHKGYFISRARKHANPVITRTHRRKYRHLVGLKLKDALQCVDEDVLDVEAEMVYQKRHRRRPLVTNHKATFRFVANYNHDHEQWHCYVTNLPTTMMRAEHFTAVYAARWEVELLFREIKGAYRIEQMPSANKSITEVLIYAALLTLLLSRRLLNALNARWRLPRQRIPFDRWAVLFGAIAHDLLDAILHRRGRAWRLQCTERFLRAEATDPNRKRIPLAHKAQQGIYRCCPSSKRDPGRRVIEICAGREQRRPRAFELASMGLAGVAPARIGLGGGDQAPSTSKMCISPAARAARRV